MPITPFKGVRFRGSCGQEFALPRLAASAASLADQLGFGLLTDDELPDLCASAAWSSSPVGLADHVAV